MGYCYYIVNKKRFDAFDMDKHWGGWPRDRIDAFASPAAVLECVIEAKANERWPSIPGQISETAQWFLTVRNRIWRWMDGAGVEDIEFMGEDGYYDYPKGMPPVTADVFGKVQGK